MVNRYIGLYCMLLFGFSIVFSDGMSQGVNTPEIGKRMPDFNLTKVTHYTKGVASLDDFKGKWLFLDFWFTGCITCIKSFPKIDSIQRQFGDKIQYVLVGKNDRQFNSHIEPLYERLRRQYNLNLVSAYDSLLGPKWNIISMPHIYIIDPNGILRYITDGRDMTVNKTKDLVSGINVSFFEKDIDRGFFSPELSSVEKGSVIYQSLLTKWNGERQNAWVDLSYPVNYLKSGTFSNISLSMVPLKWLYNWAYKGYAQWTNQLDSLYGKIYPDPILEIADPSPFKHDYINEAGRGTYNYSLIAPPANITLDKVMNILKQDLHNVFGYNVSFEKRSLPVWKLKGNAKGLKTKGGVSSVKNYVGLEIKNSPISSLLFLFANSGVFGDIPYFNETGIDYNIDVSTDAVLIDINKINQFLKKYGLELVKENRLMEVMVIKD